MLKNKKNMRIETIEKAVRSFDDNIRIAAMNACAGRDVPLEVIECGLKDSDWCVRAAAMNACAGKDVPLEVVECGLNDSNWIVRTTAMKVCEKNGISVPVTRTIEPPELVYKKCVADVIVVAEIPKDAHVRGSFGDKCRASRAFIREIIRDFCGEKVGISIYDETTSYHVGDEIVVEDFDLSNEEYSTGFHFFCTKQEAIDY